MKKQTEVILIKSSDNEKLLQTVLQMQKPEDRTLLLANDKSKFLKESLQHLQQNMENFEPLYAQMRSMLLKDSWSYLSQKHGEFSFLDELKQLVKDESSTIIYFYRIDILLDCLNFVECDKLLTKIINVTKKHNKKILFSINNTSKIGAILESLLTTIVDEKKVIEEDSLQKSSELVLIDASNNTQMVKSALKLYERDGDILLLTNKKTIFLQNTFRHLKEEIEDFDTMYAHLKCMFLKNSWSNLDNIYGTSFFIYEIQELMQDQNISTVYFHRIDKLLATASEKECQEVIKDIKEFARYFHKKVIFSINSQTSYGELLLPILSKSVDYSCDKEDKSNFLLKKMEHKPANMVLSKSSHHEKRAQL